MEVEGDGLEGSESNQDTVNDNGKRTTTTSTTRDDTVAKTSSSPPPTSSLGRGVCRIEVTRVEWNPIQPWQRTSQSKSSGTGFCIAGQRILTNAHVVKSAVDIRVRLFGSTRRVSAKTMVYAPEVDLAILEIPVAADREAFFQSSSTKEEDTATASQSFKRPKLESLALELATELPALQETVRVVGFPTGGNTICVTEGVVSRIDCDSSNHGLTIQVDSAINPGNSGGPALNRYGQVTGVAFRKRTAASNELSCDDTTTRTTTPGVYDMKAGTKVVDNIGYLIPAGVVQAFLGRIQEETTPSSLSTFTTTSTRTMPSMIKPMYTLAASMPYRWHSLENHSLRLAHRVPDHIHGILITSVYNNKTDNTDNPKKNSDTKVAAKEGEATEALSSNVLQKGDVLTKIDGKEIADDGQVVLRGDELIQHAYLMKLKSRQEPIQLEVFREPPPQPQEEDEDEDDKESSSVSTFATTTPIASKYSCKLWLRDIPTIIPRWDGVDCQPNYLILGACVLLPFNNTLRQYNKCGSLLKADCIDWCRKWPNEWQDKEGLVVLTDILAHELTFSYQRRWRRVVKYNGVDIRSLEHLRDLWQASCKEQQATEAKEEAAAAQQDKDGMSITAVKNENNKMTTTAAATTTAKFVWLELENDDDLVFEVSAAIQAQAEVMKTYEIPKAHQILPPNPNYK